jgi:hypothetical protein
MRRRFSPSAAAIVGPARGAAQIPAVVGMTDDSGLQARRRLTTSAANRYTATMSGAEIVILGKLALTFGGLLAFGLWELHKLNRDR